jgi:prepilin-type N-terminal cleavage/methylation domain-containing protein
MLIQHQARRARMRGFTLIEMMVAMALGLIVMAAVLALVLSIIRSNNQTVQATRLTQELRATAAVIASDLKRARGVQDPLAAAKQGNLYANVYLDNSVANPPDGTAGQCIRYGYAGASGGGFHVIRLNGGKVSLAEAATEAGATCALAGQPLNSSQVNISNLLFTISGRQVTVTLTGGLVAGDSQVISISRTLSQTVFIRSVGS